MLLGANGGDVRCFLGPLQTFKCEIDLHSVTHVAYGICAMKYPTRIGDRVGIDATIRNTYFATALASDRVPLGYGIGRPKAIRASFGF